MRTLNKKYKKDLNNTGNETFLMKFKSVILFVSFAICVAGWYGAVHMRSSVFPETNFPRCVVLIDNGVMPANEMMASITRPIEEALKDIPGVVQVKSATGRGAAEVNVFFDWNSDMVQNELFVLGRIAQIKSQLPQTATTKVVRLTFNAFPIIGISLTSEVKDLTELWEIARYEIKPKFLKISGVASVDLVGGRKPEYYVIIDPLKLNQANVGVNEVKLALENTNVIIPVGFHAENYTLYLSIVNGRSVDQSNILSTVIRASSSHPILLGDVATVKRMPEPIFNVVSAQGKNAVLLNIRAQPSGSNVQQIAANIQDEVEQLKLRFPNTHLSYYYDQSIFVDASASSAWEAILIGLMFAVMIIFAFLKNLISALTTVVIIPVSILSTTLVLFIMDMSFNLMTLGGIAAAVGLIIDDAIVVTESIYQKLNNGLEKKQAIDSGLKSILKPIIASTLTPVVVFIPLIFLDGLPGVFFRALAITMVVALISSLIFAITLTPVLTDLFSKTKEKLKDENTIKSSNKTTVMSWLENRFKFLLRTALKRFWITPLISLFTIMTTMFVFNDLDSDFMPEIDEGGFIIDYQTPWGTSLEETDRMMREAEAILTSIEDVDGYSRRTGARLALAIAEPNTGDFLVKLKKDRKHSTEQIKIAIRNILNEKLPVVEWEFPGILGDLIGDLTWSPSPIEIKLYSTDNNWLKENANLVEEIISEIPGVVDVSNGVIMTGPTIFFEVQKDQASRFGLNTLSIANAVKTALLGVKATSILEGDRIIDIRIKLKRNNEVNIEDLKSLMIKTQLGTLVKLEQVANLKIDEGQMELHREDLRGLVAVTADLEGISTGNAIELVKQSLNNSKVPLKDIEFGGLFEQQTKAFENLLIVLFLGIVLVFTVLLIEFRSIIEPISIVLGSMLALAGMLFALYITDLSLNIISFLGAIIGVGIVAKNGILVLDSVHYFRRKNNSLVDSIILSSTCRLRPILMTTLATILAMLPMAWGISHGSDMLKPLAVSIIGSLSVSMLFSLFITPAIYYYLVKLSINISKYFKYLPELPSR